MRIVRILISFAVILLSSRVGICGIPVIVAKKVALSSITIDGRLKEKEWDKAKWSKSFVIVTDGKESSSVSRFKVVYDDMCLYIATSFEIVSKEKLLVRSSADTHDMNLWEEDCVEIFVSPTIKDEFNYYHFIANVNDARYEGLGYSAGWDGKWVVATSIKDGIWFSEVAIPFSSLGVKRPKKGDVWRINVAREDKVADEITGWSALFSNSLHIGEQFGFLVFGEITADARKKIKEVKKQIVSKGVRCQKEIVPRKRRKILNGCEYVPLCRIEEKKREELEKQILIIWEDSPLVYPKKFALPYPIPQRPKELSVLAGKNEHRSAVVNFFNPLKYGVDVRMWISMVKGDDKDKWKKLKQACKFYRPIFVQSKTKKYMADAMCPLDLSGVMTIPAGQCRQLWIDVDTHYLKAGSYRAILNVKCLDRHISARYWRIPFKIVVWDFAVPDKMPIRVQMWEYTETRVPIEPWLDDMKVHYVNGFFHGGWLNSLNHITLPERIGSELVSAYTIRTSGLKLKDTILPKHQRGQIMFGYGVIELFEQRLAGRFKLKFMSPRWKKVFKEYVLTMRDYLKSIGIKPKDYVVELWDEADGGVARRVLVAGRYLKSFAPEIRTMMDVTTKCPAKRALKMNPVVDVWCPSLERITAIPSELELYRKTGKEIWAYQCPVGVTDSSAFEQCRKFAWWAWKFKLDGIAYWVYDYPRDDPFDNYDWGGYPDTCMVYGDYRITSRRWESWREGMEDYLYLYLLKNLVAKAEEAGMKKEKLVKYVELIDKLVGNVVISQRPVEVETARILLGKNIVELKSCIKSY